MGTTGAKQVVAGDGNGNPLGPKAEALLALSLPWGPPEAKGACLIYELNSSRDPSTPPPPEDQLSKKRNLLAENTYKYQQEVTDKQIWHFYA